MCTHTCPHMHTLPDSELPKGPASRALISRNRILGESSILKKRGFYSWING